MSTTDLTPEEEAELRELIDGVFDPGCEAASRINSLLPLAESSIRTAALMVIEEHCRRTTEHQPGCSASRPAN